MRNEINIPSIAVVGGIGVGKSTLISSLWNLNSIIGFDVIVNEDVSGRGMMQFSVCELPDVIYDSVTDWMNDESNLNKLNNSDVMLFVLPASSFGYNQEVKFIKKIITSECYHGQNIIICLAKSDYVLFEINDDNNNSEESLNINAASELLQKANSIYMALENCLSREHFSADCVIPVSADGQWNYDALKEKLWEGVVSKVNDLIYDPTLPTIVIAGKRGCGKSSTLNILWNLNLPTNKSVACTKYPMVINVEGIHNNTQYSFNVVDLPGIAESLDADMQYTSYYEKYVKNATLLICLTQADTRAYLQDEEFYKQLISLGLITNTTKIILGINQIDLLFKTKENPQGIDLRSITTEHKLITDKITDYYDNVFANIFLSHPNVKKTDICVYSVIQNWNIDSLNSMILTKLIN